MMASSTQTQRFALALGVSVLVAVVTSACAGAVRYVDEDCPVYTELAAVRVNPAGALGRHLRVEASFRVCPPEEGLAEIRRKHIELKHEIVSLLSRKTEEDLADPLRVEKLRWEMREMVNDKVLKRSRVLEVYITGMELE